MKELNLIATAIKPLFDKEIVDADTYLKVCLNLANIEDKLPKFKLKEGKLTNSIAYYDSWSKQLLITNEIHKKFRKYKLYLCAMLVYLNDVDQNETRFIAISNEISFYSCKLINDDICWSLNFPRYEICEGNESLKMNINFVKVNKYLLKMDGKSCYVWKKDIKSKYTFNGILASLISKNANSLEFASIDRSTNKKISLETLVELLFNC